MAKSLDDLARTIAAGFRAMKNEMRSQRVAIAQTQQAVVEYSRSVEDRDERRAKLVAELADEVAELKRTVRGH